MAPWLFAGTSALLAGSRLGSALRVTEPEEPPTVELLSEVLDDTAPSGVTKRAHTEWWTLHPPEGRRRGSELPQCCGRRVSACTEGFEVPSYVGPAPANFAWDPAQLRKALSGRRLVMIGDSLTLEWSNALACYLTGDTSWDRDFYTAGSKHWLSIVRKINRHRTYPLPTDDDPRGVFKYNRLHLGDVGGEIVTYMNHGFWPRVAEGLLALHASDPEERADLVIINQGAHYNEPGIKNGSTSLRADLVDYMNICKAQGLRCILRESSAQHFKRKDLEVQSGLYYNTASEHECIGSRYNEKEEFFYDSIAEWRREELVAALAEVGQNSSVMPLFDATLPLTFAHHRTPGDCTHWAMNTEYWEPWHAALFGLLEQL